MNIKFESNNDKFYTIGDGLLYNFKLNFNLYFYKGDF